MDRFGARLLPGVPDYDQLLIMAIAAMVIGLLVSLLTEYLLKIPVFHAVEVFRDHPFRWLRSRSVLALGLLILVSSPLLWLGSPGTDRRGGATASPDAACGGIESAMGTLSGLLRI